MRRAFVRYLRPSPGTAASTKSPEFNKRQNLCEPRTKAAPQSSRLRQDFDLEQPESFEERLKAERRPSVREIAELDYSPDLIPGWHVVRKNLNISRLVKQFRWKTVVAWLIEDGPNAAPSRTTTVEPQAQTAHSMACAFVQVLSTSAVDTPGAMLLLEFPNRRYLFGQVAEGTTRLMVEQKHSLTKLEHVFLTGSVSSAGCGGILGLLLSVADVEADKSRAGLRKAEVAERREKKRPLGGRGSLTIHAGPNLTHFMATARNFVFRRAFDARLREMRADPRLDDPTDTTPDFEDDNIKVWQLRLASPSTKKRGIEDVDRASEDSWVKRLGLEGGQEARFWGLLEREANKTPEMVEADHQIRQEVVKAMFSSGTIRTIQAQRLPEVEMPACILQAGEQNKAKIYDGPLPGEKDCPDITVGVVGTVEINGVDVLPHAHPDWGSSGYIVKCRDRRGKFNPAKAKALGVKTTDFKRLTNKETVVGPDGLEVTPEMVLEPDIKGRAFAVLQCFHFNHLRSLEARPEFKDKDIVGELDVIYWIIADLAGAYFKSRLQTFMASFPKTTHIIMTRFEDRQLAFESAAAHTIRLNQIDPDRFPLASFEKNKGDVGLGSNQREGRVGAMYRLGPRPGHDDSQVRPLMDTMAPVKEVMSKPEVVGLAQAARDRVASAAFLQEVAELEKDMPSREAEVMTLGTGSALPSKYRNVSATLVRVPGHGCYLFDCGENTLGQLSRTCGIRDAEKLVRELRVIFVSHLHADHHLGIISLIRSFMAITKADDNPPDLCIMASRSFLDYIREYHCIDGLYISRLKLVSLGYARKDGVDSLCQLTSPDKIRPHGSGSGNRTAAWPSDDWPRLLSTLGLVRVDACYVDHTPSSAAVVFEWPTGLRVAYSGDCRPSVRLAKIARDVDLLIHECTFDDEKAEVASKKKHSTMSEALGVARDCRARRVLLTHFSQRYPKIALLSDSARAIVAEAGSPPVLTAFDGMRVKLGDFRAAELFRPAIEKLYENDAPEDVPMDDVAEVDSIQA